MNAREDRPALPVLTTLRFFAAFHVVLFHGAEGLVSQPVVKSFIGTGFIAVDFFFVLSGFVLAYKYVGKGGALTGTVRDFWSARFARVYPVYVLSLAVGAPFYLSALFHSGETTVLLAKAAISGVACLLLVQSWFFRVAGSWNGPAWSLSVEAFLYLAFPLITPRLLRLVRNWGAVIIVISLWGFAMSAPTAYMLARPDGVESITSHTDGTWLSTLRFTPVVHLPSFLIGVVTGWSFVQRRVSTPAWVGLAVTLLVVGALCGGAWLPYPHLHAGLLAPAFAGLIYCAAGAQGHISRALSSRPLVELGEASYALYLLHYPLLEYAQKWNRGALNALQFTVYCVVVQVLCIAIFRCFESPSRRWLRGALS